MCPKSADSSRFSMLTRAFSTNNIACVLSVMCGAKSSHQIIDTVHCMSQQDKIRPPLTPKPARRANRTSITTMKTDIWFLGQLYKGAADLCVPSLPPSPSNLHHSHSLETAQLHAYSTTPKLTCPKKNKNEAHLHSPPFHPNTIILRTHWCHFWREYHLRTQTEDFFFVKRVSSAHAFSCGKMKTLVFQQVMVCVPNPKHAFFTTNTDRNASAFAKNKLLSKRLLLMRQYVC